MKELTIEITNRCSLDCLFCSTQAGKKGNIFVSPKQVEGILDKHLTFQKVRISGGEPFENPHLEKILETVFEKGRQCQVMSCGVKQDKEIPLKVFTKIAPLITDIVFSYHGFYTDHEEIVRPGTTLDKRFPYWDFMMDSLDNAYYANIPVSFQTVVIGQNYDKLEDMAKTIGGLRRVLPKIGEWHLLRFVPQGRGNAQSSQALTKEQNNNLPGLVEQWRKKYNLPISYTHAFDMKECDCGSEKSVVTVMGDEIPCSALKYGAKSGCKFPCLRK